MEKVIRDIIADLLEKVDIAYEKINVEKRADGSYKANIESSEYSPLLIGFHGETILAFQHLVKILAWKKVKGEVGEGFTFNLDVDDYNARQEEMALDIAKRKIDEAVTQERSIELPPMKPFLRKKVHMYIAELENSNLTTESVGEGDGRRIKIVYKD